LRATSNPIENFKYAFEDVFINKLIERMDGNQDIFEKIMENNEFKNDVKDFLIKKIYERFNKEKELSV
jgi:type I restriction enzyme R subunit